MALSKQEWIKLEDKAHGLRMSTLQTCAYAGSGHLGGSFSAIDILTALYYRHMKFNPKKYDDPDRDRCVVSKGHIGIALAPLFVDLGLVDEEQLKTFNLTGSKLGIHLDSNKVKGLDSSTGSLGHGSAMALGMALAGRVHGKDYKVYLILGDGECDEGSVWEAAMATAHFKAANVITIVDRNSCMIDGPTEEIMKLEPFADKWKAFGFEVIEIDGHDFVQLDDALERAKNAKDKPVCIIANTVKGQGVKMMAGNYKWHYGAMNDDNLVAAKADLAEYHAARVARAEKEGK